MRSAHEVFGTAQQVIDQRRALYSAVLDVASRRPVHADDAVLDNPAVRGHLGAVSGGAALEPDELVTIERFVDHRAVRNVLGNPVMVAATATARVGLRGALDRIVGELRSNGDTHARVELMIDGEPGYARSARRVLDGIRLAARLAPELVADLLPHVALFGIVSAPSAGRLGSASAREYPGLVLLPAPDDALEAAEALVHEGAHQKFFDLASTRSFIGADSLSAPLLRVSWAAEDAPEWPLEQAFAAWHAYCCLDVMWSAVSTTDIRVHDTSLLPKAAYRRTEIGGWLLRQGQFLGIDGRRLLSSVTGECPSGPGVSDRSEIQHLAERSPRVVRRIGSRALVSTSADEIVLYWVDSAPTGPR